MKVINTFKDSNRIVIKIGSSLLTNAKGNVNKSVLKNVVNDITSLIKKKKEIILVSSGAISLGKGKLKLNKELTLNESQAIASIGQISLMSSSLQGMINIEEEIKLLENAAENAVKEGEKEAVEKKRLDAENKRYV